MSTPLVSRLVESQFLRYLLAGAANTLFGFSVYAFAIITGAPIWVALLIANIAGIAFNFVTVGSYVFRSLLFTRFPRFLAAYLFIYAINLKLLAWLLFWIPGEIVAQAIITCPMAAVAFLIMKKFVFPMTNSSCNES